MEAKHATDCAPWKEHIDPVAARSVAGAIDELAEFPVLDATVLAVKMFRVPSALSSTLP